MSIDTKSEYYDMGGIETLEVIRAKLTPEQFDGYCIGSVIKYLCRANWKNPSMYRDLEKAANYLKLLPDFY